ncbi:spore maturation protein [Kyrpidia spormannii]|uniref:Spore maturation protein n=1 Tax=Kyrpidia spormannii TaxID=2055160 RepID=A0A2K8N834_9BACL|nr:nucleoside recognition domain-containing protein [Kyrpidia spormannii]ATY84760.1 spore maturation protein [Kyrpidia spormannii]
MVSALWLGLLISGFVAAAFQGKIDIVTQSMLKGAEEGVAVALGLISILVLWLGVMRVAEEAGLIAALARLLRPLAGWLFPSVPADHPAMGSILSNMSANILGLGNAATPLGLKAMRQLQELNPDKEQASDAMCTLLALNTASLTLLPTTVIALRMQYGATSPTDIVAPTILATAVGTAAAIFLDRYYRRREARGRRGAKK